MADVRNKVAAPRTAVVATRVQVEEKKPAPPPPPAQKRGWLQGVAPAARPGADGFQSARTASAAPKKAPPPTALITSNDQQINLGDPAFRREIAVEATQSNTVSYAAGNANDICGGASLASALVLASGKPEDAKGNAEAMRKIFSAHRIQLPAGVERAALEKALDHLGQGTLSRDDLFNLQQGLYAAARTYGPPPQDAGVNVAQMSGLVAELKGRGATLGKSSMVEVDVSENRSQPVAHWVAQTDLGLINTGFSTVPPAWLSPLNGRWSGDVSVGEKVTFRTSVVVTQDGRRIKAEAGKGWAGALTPKDPNSVAQMNIPGFNQQLGEAAASFDPKKPQTLK